MWTEYSRPLVGVFLDSSLRAFLVAASVATVLRAARVRCASVRHAAWTAVLCAMMLMPVLPHCVPTIAVPVSVPSPTAAAVPLPEEPEPSARVSAHPAVPSSNTASEVSQATVTQVQATPHPIWPPIALIGYGLGALALLSRLLLGWRVLGRIVRASRRIVLEADYEPVPMGIPVYESPLIATPVTAGLISRKILLPVAWNLWPDEKLRAVLAHELAHARRRDPLVSFLAGLNRCVFWFHPLAWWLERKLATTAEQACDDAAVLAIGNRRRYAEVLIDMSEEVRRSGGRLSWQGIGVHGRGRLGRRIDRVLRGDLFREMSRRRKFIVAFSCAASIFVIVACRLQQKAPAPLQENPQIAAQRARRKAETEFVKAARSMNAQQVADLEIQVKKNPEDLVALRKLLVFYAPISLEVPGEKGKWAPVCAQVIGEKPCIAARRPHVLWLIEHHPSDRLAGEWAALIFPTSLDPLPDPAGYAEARKLWLAQTARPDASVEALGNAARFFEVADKPLAEQMLLRAQTLDPKGHWSAELGRLYALVLRGANSSMPLNVVRSVSVAEANSAYAQEIRKKLAETSDPELLNSAAQYLERARLEQAGNKLGFDPAVLGQSYAERAERLDPQSGQARLQAYRQRVQERSVRLQEVLRDVPKDSQYQAISNLPESERFQFLPQLAITSYLDGEGIDYYKHDLASAKAAWERAGNYARDALQLAHSFVSSPDYGTAVYMGNLVLGLVTFREGDRQNAVKYLLAASRAPSSEDLDYSVHFHTRLTGYLLKYGERESVIKFLENLAHVVATQSVKNQLLEAAMQIRNGIQPFWYPREATQ